MKNRLRIMACSATIATAMLFQVLSPSVALAAKMTDGDADTEITVETSAETSETSDETSPVDVSEPSSSTDYTYVEETEDLSETEATEPSSDETDVISSATDTDPTDETVAETEETEALEPEYSYSVVLPDDFSVFEEDVVTVTAVVEATLTLGDDVTDLDYTLEYTCGGADVINTSGASVSVSYANAGVYTIVSNLVVDGEVVASDSVDVTVFEGVEYVEFDHYFSQINENDVQTTDLMVQTSDASVFTRNTNVVSNFDNVYIISCDTVEQARFVYSYYVNRVVFICDLSSAASVATGDGIDADEPTADTPSVDITSASTQDADIADLSNLNNGNDAIANLSNIDTDTVGYSGYVALIDTGANANVNYSVIGDDTSDNNGHGSQMLGYIREENPYARVVSIKVSEDGRASAADIYAGFRLAIDLGVSTINFSMTGLDREQNAIIKTIIQEALDAGIVVIGSAGNNGVSARIFIPGSIDGVITIGAVDEYGNKIVRSNYNADYYVVANSTSEAAARYTGLYTAGLADISLKVFDQVVEDDDYQADYAWAYEAAQIMTDNLQAEYGYGFVEVVFNDDGSPAWHFCMDETAQDGFFAITAGGWDINTDATTDLGVVSSSLAPGTYNGQCNFTYDASGKGHVNSFDNAFGTWLNSVGANNVGFICSKYFSEVSDSSQSAGARSLESGTVYYQAVCTDTGAGRRILITISDRADMSQPEWDTTVSATQSYTVDYVDSTHLRVTIGGNSQVFNLQNAATLTTAAIGTYISNTITTEYSGKKNPTVISTGFSAPTSAGSSKTCTATYTYNVASGCQVYAGLVTTGETPTYGSVRVRKVDSATNTGLAGCTLTLSGSFEGTPIVTGAQSASYSNGVVTFVTSTSTVEIRGLKPNSSYTLTETGAPPNYDIAMPASVTFTTDADGNPHGATTGPWNWNQNGYTWTLADGTTQGGWGSLAITKTWSGTPMDNYCFWNSVSSVSFAVTYMPNNGGASSRELAQNWADGGSMRGRSPFTYGTLNAASISGNSARVYWSTATEYRPNGPGDVGGGRAYYRFLDYTGSGQFEEYSGSTSNLNYLPLDTYYIVTESWQGSKFSTEHNAIYIRTLNDSGWRAISNGSNGYYCYFAVYHVDDEGRTWFCDPYTLDHSRMLSGIDRGQFDDASQWEDDYYYDIVDNETDAGNLDVIKVDESGIGVDGVSFEVRMASNNELIGTGTCAGTPTVVNGRDTYDVRWNYTTLRSVDWTFIHQWGQRWEYSHYPQNNHYYLQESFPLEFSGDTWTYERFIERVQYERSHPSEFGYPDRDNDLYMTIAWLPPTVDLTTGALNAVSRTNAEYISGLPYGNYYIYEYIRDASGNSLCDTYEIPAGWEAIDANNDGTTDYFRKTVSVTDSSRTAPVEVECVNRICGIDVSKVSLTGGPLTDLVYEVIDSSNTVVATGYIPRGATTDPNATGSTAPYTYSASWTFERNGVTYTDKPIAPTGFGTFTVREYVPVSALEESADLTVSGGFTYGGVTTRNGLSYYYYDKTVTVDNTGDAIVTVPLTNEVHPTIHTTLTDFADRHITVVGETIEFTDVVAYEDCYIGATYEMHARLMEPIYDANGNIVGAQPITDRNGNYYENTVTFTTTAGSGTVSVAFTVNTADLVEAVQLANGVVQYEPKNVVCFESMTLVGGYEIANHNQPDDASQTVEIPNPEIGTEFTDLQTYEHRIPTGRIVEVVDSCSFTNLHIGEHYSLTCFLYDQTTGDQLMYSDNTPVVGRLDDFVPQTESGIVNVTFTIDTSDLIVNVFAYEERPLVAFEYLRSASGILIGGHTDIDDIAQHNTIPTPPTPRSSLIDDQTGTHEGVIGAAVPVTDTVWYTNLNIDESYQIRGYIVDRDNPSIVYATQIVDFVPQTRDGTVEVNFVVDTSWVCEGNREAYLFCIEEIWQLDTQNTGRGEVRLANENDPRNQDQCIHLVPECHTTMNDVVTQSHYGMIGTDVVLEDTVAYYNLHIGETYTCTGVLMDKQTGLPVMQNGQPVTATTTFVAPTQDGTVVVTYHVDTLALIQQIGTTVSGITIDAPREVVSFETITSTSGYDFEIHADINDENQTIIIGDITSHAGDLQTSTSWLASGLTTVRDVVHYRGLGPVEYTLRGSLHLVDYDENGQPIDGGLIYARPGEVTELEYTWTPSNHEGDVNFDFKLDSNRYQGRNIVVFEELWYNGTCIVSHENYSDSYGNFGMYNLDQTVHIASVWTSAFSFQSGEQLLAYTTDATVTDFVYCGNLDVGQRYYCEASLWACYTDENGYIHNVPLTQEEGGIACSPVFTAEQNHAVAEVTFHIDATKYFDQHYDYLLVTERLIHVGSGVCIATHSDLTSKEQSINIPELHTTFTSACGHMLPDAPMADVMPVTLTDRVQYENLICDGRSYTVVGNVQYARTDAQGNITESGPLMQNGQPVTNSVTFVPTSPTGYVDVTFEVNAADIRAHGYDKIVAFEDLYFGPEGIRVGTHSDIYDQEQTCTVPMMHTTALGQNGRHSVQATSSVTIIDTVYYEGLEADGVRQYRLETDLMSSKTGGSVAHVTSYFTPTSSSGYVTVELTFDATGYTSSDFVVVFENMYYDEVGDSGASSWLIGRHESWDDTEQTVTFGGGGDTGVNDYNTNRFLYCAMACFTALIGIGGYTLIQNRRKKNEVDPTRDTAK